MVLYPLNTSLSDGTSSQAGGVRAAGGLKASGNGVSAWEAVERRQKQVAQAWWLVAQPDHAALSGDLAASISSPYFPKLDTDVVQAITLHDEGWAQFDRAEDRASSVPGSRRTTRDDERPLSFLEMSPSEFLYAWSDSIRRAEESSTVGGILVSQHFCRLAESRLQMGADSRQDTDNIRSFIASEAERQHRLAARNKHSDEEICTLVDVLQFCDLLSLYLCCGALEDVEFPQRFHGKTILLRRDGEMCRTEPPIFARGASLGVSVRRYPHGGESNVTTLGFLLA